MKTILVVDDYASVRFYHMSLLRNAGYNTIAATSGVEALALLQQHIVDLVMLDLVMPNMSGQARAPGACGSKPARPEPP